MNKYIVTKTLTLHHGIIALSKEQAAKRIHNLNHIKDDQYEIVVPVQFKIGETIGHDGEIPKVLADSLETEKDAKAAEGSDYARMKKKELQDEAKSRGLQFTAHDKKIDLIAMLEADDAADHGGDDEGEGDDE